MELTVLNTSFEAVSIIDDYESLIWTDRYHECGDFELYMFIDRDILNNIKEGYYLRNQNSKHTMIIEQINIKTDSEDGNRLVITGRSFESVLDRRIVWYRTVLDGSFQSQIRNRLIDRNIISPIDEPRKIDKISFVLSSDPIITGINIESQYIGDSVYEVIKKNCEEYGIGFRMISLNNNDNFIFEFYAGVDRSYDQSANPYVIFSPEFDNIIDSDYMETKKSLKNVALVVGGEPLVDNDHHVTVEVGNNSGLNRREIFIDAGDIVRTVDGETMISIKYRGLLRKRGTEELTLYTETKSFYGQVDSNIMFEYEKDFFLGDVVQIEDEYGNEGKVRIIEVITSVNNEGTFIYPTFKLIT